MNDYAGMYNNACAFYDCAEMTMKKAMENVLDNPFNIIVPAVVNCAFSCELFLKLIIECLGKKYGKVHDLEKLFNILPQEMQNRINEKVFYKTGKSNSVFGIRPITLAANYFNNWRYSFEKPNITADMGYLFGLCSVLKEEAISLLPIQ